MGSQKGHPAFELFDLSLFPTCSWANTLLCPIQSRALGPPQRYVLFRNAPWKTRVVSVVASFSYIIVSLSFEFRSHKFLATLSEPSVHIRQRQLLVPGNERVKITRNV